MKFIRQTRKNLVRFQLFEWSGTSEEDLNLRRNSNPPTSASPPTYTATQHQIAIVGTSPVISALTADIFNTPDTPDTAPAIQQTSGIDMALQLSRPLGPAPSTRRTHWIRLEPPASSPEGFANESSTADID
ncbi:hypothetical protein CCHR01_12362 [Colletotrichum chrysophilum]|uniref:Uncharacterized protein n=1 Tax=Colletotrichum chrysophilum TaxID=1836956 RepID=A0AAD9AG79_9PEZI|nr:hypothetical protein CCHR01_12362 [Colletotrichum chrysophilum]